MRVLLVEDSRSDAALVREHLADAAPDARLLVAPSLAHAVARLGEGSVDCVLVDLSLPDAVGLEALRAIASAAPEVPVVVLSAAGQEPLAAQAVRAGAQDYLVKGEAPGSVLARALRHAVQGARAQREHGSPWRLPREARDAPERARPGAAASGREKEPVRVFLCDDVADLRALLRAFLEKDGAYAVVGEAGDGARLAGAVATARAEVVLLDLSMPEVDGLEAVAALRAADPTLGIVVLSGFEQARMEAQALALGADRYLEKRAGMAEVRRTVAEVALARREPR